MLAAIAIGAVVGVLVGGLIYYTTKGSGGDTSQCQSQIGSCQEESGEITDLIKKQQDQTSQLISLLVSCHERHG
ncbi:MAG: hypothetical protein HOJ34_14470 [Kordiimonadaceae bacterium]|jgi:hypothetical protein|nr:hypothetical protein [Kordiimonadaceae bacterium]MBT6330979.1 hypothetical protein [Kordiimonadaceae bacterium]